jgi:uncharacterized membrane protein YedE/YeeE
VGGDFRFGMVLAGGCANRHSFRVGEGNIQYIMALWGHHQRPLFSQFPQQSVRGRLISLIDKLGRGLVGRAGILAIWFLIVQWNEMRVESNAEEKVVTRIDLRGETDRNRSTPRLV